MTELSYNWANWYQIPTRNIFKGYVLPEDAELCINAFCEETGTYYVKDSYSKKQPFNRGNNLFN